MVCQRPTCFTGRGRIPFTLYLVVSLALVGLGGTLLSCSGSGTDKSVSSRSSSKPIVAPPVSLPPESCELVATVIDIDPVAPGTSGPCGVVPCLATVRIDSVLGYGSAYPHPLAPGELVKAHFAFTVAPTINLFPTKTSLSAPLTKGSMFKALAESRPTGINGAPDGVEIADYEKR